MKKALLIISVLLVLAAIPVTILLVKQQQDIRQRADPATTMYLEGPQTVNINTDNGSFTLDVKLDTEENYVANARVDVEIDPAYLEIVSLEKFGSFLPNELAKTEPSGNSASVSVGVQAGTQGAHGQNQTIAKLVLRAHRNTPAGSPTEVKLKHPPSLVIGGGIAPLDQYPDKGTDVLISAESKSITVTGGEVASPTPTPVASPSPTTSPAPRVSPSPTPINLQVTKITAPTNNSTITNRRPTITGESFPGVTLTLTLKRGNTVVATPSLTVDAQGNWSYPVTTDLVNGVYSVTAVATDPDTGEVENALSAFTVADAPSGGGTASPTPPPSATPSSGEGQSSPATSTVPVTGSATPTIILLGLAVLLLSLGASLAFLF